MKIFSIINKITGDTIMVNVNRYKNMSEAKKDMKKLYPDLIIEIKK